MIYIIMYCLSLKLLATHVCEKDIQYFINLNFKVIIVKRVFHDMFKSYLNRFQTNETKAIFAHKEYLEKIEYYHFNKKEKRQIQIIDYEDLVNNKSKTFNQISSFLDFKISMPKKFYHNFSKNVSYLAKKVIISANITMMYLIFW